MVGADPGSMLSATLGGQMAQRDPGMSDFRSGTLECQILGSGTLGGPLDIRSGAAVRSGSVFATQL